MRHLSRQQLCLAAISLCVAAISFNARSASTYVASAGSGKIAVSPATPKSPTVAKRTTETPLPDAPNSARESGPVEKSAKPRLRIPGPEGTCTIRITGGRASCQESGLLFSGIVLNCASLGIGAADCEAALATAIIVPH
jgi:hypothetical protein